MFLGRRRDVGRSQGGNNNAYCQDNEVSWYDWGRLRRYGDVHRFVREMIRLRRKHPSLRRRRFVVGHDTERPVPAGITRVRWHGTELDTPDWSESSRTVAFTLLRTPDDTEIHVILNMHDEELEFAVPPTDVDRWHRVVDTAAASAARCLRGS